AEIERLPFVNDRNRLELATDSALRMFLDQTDQRQPRSMSLRHSAVEKTYGFLLEFSSGAKPDARAPRPGCSTQGSAIPSGTCLLPRRRCKAAAFFLPFIHVVLCVCHTLENEYLLAPVQHSCH